MSERLPGGLYNEAPVSTQQERPRQAEDPTPDANWADAFMANWRLNRDDRQDFQMSSMLEGYRALEDTLVDLGHARGRYNRPEFSINEAIPEFARARRNAIWADVVAARSRNPQLFRDVPQTQEEFELWARRRRGQREIDQRVAANGGFGTALLPGLIQGVVGMFEAENIPQLAMGGGASSTAGLIAREVLSNALVTGADTPRIAINRAALGENYTAREMDADVAIAGITGGVFAGGQIALGRFISGRRMAGADMDDGALARHAADTIPAEARTPEVNSAIAVLERQGDIDAVNPYHPDAQGLDAHVAQLRAAMENLNEGGRVAARIHAPEPAAPSVRVDAPAPTPTAARPVARSTRGASSGGAIPLDVVQFFQGRGYTTAQARGIAAGIVAESGADHTIRNPTSGAFGLGQHLGPRQRELFRRYGRNPTRLQQLEFLDYELKGGDHGGAAVRGAQTEEAVLHAYITRFMRPAKGAETSGDMRRGMAALGREYAPGMEEGGASSALANLSVPETAPYVRSAALDAVRPTVVGPERAVVPMQSFRPDEIDVDANLMQFKSGGDSAGVTERLRGVAAWDPMAAGAVTVWQANDGRLLIADGHQRLGLARRLQADQPDLPISLNAFVLREADGFTARDARVLTALKNISEGSGSAIDAAKVFREAGAEIEDAIARRLPPRSALVRDGKALSRLSPDAFGAVVNDVVPESYGAAIGHLAPDPDTHAALIDVLAATEPANRRQAESIVRQALSAGFTKETQLGLFGAQDVTTALFAQRARVLDRSLSELKKMRGVFQVAARNADTLESTGSKIAVDASAAAAEGNARALAIVERLAHVKGDVSDLLNHAAQRIANGEPIGNVVRDVVGAIRELDLAQLGRHADDGSESGGAGRHGDAAGGSGRGDVAEYEAGRTYADDGSDPLDPYAITPAERDALEAAGQAGFTFFDEQAGQAFDAPDSPGALRTTDSLWHDIDAAAIPDDATFDLGDGLGERSMADIRREIDADQAAIDAIRRCM